MPEANVKLLLRNGLLILTAIHITGDMPTHRVFDAAGETSGSDEVMS